MKRLPTGCDELTSHTLSTPSRLTAASCWPSGLKSSAVARSPKRAVDFPAFRSQRMMLAYESMNATVRPSRLNATFDELARGIA